MSGSRPVRLGAVLFAVLMVGSVVAPAAALGTGPTPDGVTSATERVPGSDDVTERVPGSDAVATGGPGRFGAGTGSSGTAPVGVDGGQGEGGSGDGRSGDPGDGRANDSRPRGLDAGALPADRPATALRNFDGSADGPVRVVVVLDGDPVAGTGPDVDRLRDMGASVESTSGRVVSARIDPADLPEYRALPWVERVRRPYPAVPTEVSEGVEVIDADDVHDAGITGEDVKVGVIDVTGFEESNPEISDNIADQKEFAEDPGRTAHGTAVAEVVVDTAPDAELYLTNFDTLDGFRSAKEWLLAQGVDVVVMSVGIYGQPNDGTGPYAGVIDDAVGNGAAWVNAAGNEAEVHWEGEFADGDGDGLHNFTDDAELNYLNGGTPIQGRQRVRAFLTWDEWHDTDQDYDLYLVNESGGVVASSTRAQDGNDRAFEYVDTVVPGGERYAVVVENYDASGDQSLELFVKHLGELEYGSASGSIVAPATANRVTAVGAVDHEDLSLEWYSSHGPTNDGRRGLDLVGPTGISTDSYTGSFSGTSAAAPHVAGVAALVESADGSLSPGELEDLLTDTARDVRARGPDDATGYGVVDASAAVARASDDYPPGAGASVSASGPPELAPGASGTVEVELDVDGPVDEATLSATFDPRFASVTNTRATLDGPGSVSSTDASRAGVEVTATDLASDSTLVLATDVTMPGDATGSHSVSTGAMLGDEVVGGPTLDVALDDSAPARPSDPGPDDVPAERNGTALADYAGDADEVSVAVELAPDADDDAGSYADRLRDRGATVDSVSERWIHMRIDPSTVEEYRDLAWVVGAYRPHAAHPAVTADVDGLDADRSAAATVPGNVTGSNVSVGVLSPVAVNLSDTPLSDRVVAERTFGAVPVDASGTAVAGALASEAPGADLYVASFEDSAGYYNGTRWLRAEGVDVVVMPANFYGAPGDGTGPVSGVAEGAVGDGIAWVNPTGDAARNHWRGEFADGDGDGIHNFSGDAEFAFLGDGAPLAAGQAVEAWLTWDDWPATDRDYDLYLFDGNGDVVAWSVRAQAGDDPPRERITYTVPESGYYALAVVAHDAEGTATLDLTVARGGPLSVRSAEGSTLAPATSPDVTAVGAVDAGDRSVLPDSGRGPTADGRLGVDVVDRGGIASTEFGPAGGTGVASARVAGVAALVEAANDSLTPAELETLLESTADDLGPEGPDGATGHGLVNATAAVGEATPGDGPLGTTVDRDAPAYLPPGESATVTTEVRLARAIDRFRLAESFGPAFADATITEVSIDGDGTVSARTADAAGVEVTASDLSAGSTLTVTYRVTAPADGDGTFAIAAELAGDGTATGGPASEVLVRAQSDARSVDGRSVRPGGETVVTTTVTVEEASERVSVIESIDPAAEATVEEVAVDGNGTVLFDSGGEGSVSAALQGVGAGTTVEVTYALAVPGSAREGDLVTITGRATVGGSERSLGPTTLVVAGGLAGYANDDGVIDTTSLREVIRDWAAGEVSTEFLREAIRAWATGEPVG